MKKPVQLHLESLETRLTPSTIGLPWPDPAHLTVSFTPDGTQVNGTKVAGGVGSTDLFHWLGRGRGQSAWETEILRAIQTWAVNANINLGLVPDSNLPYSTAGDAQGDTRFGDIRIGATSLSTADLATTSPFDWSLGTWSGNVLFNDKQSVGINPQGQVGQYDLFTIALHEAGHIFGLGDNDDDPQSVMYDSYLGPRAGLAPEDIQALQALYGTRQPDSYEGATGNNSLATAAALPSTDHLVANGDITNIGEADYYTVTTPAISRQISIQVVTTGVSLLVPTLTIYDASFNPIYSASASDPTGITNLTFQTSRVPPGTTYYIRVSDARNDVFGIGSYQLHIDYTKPRDPNDNTNFVQDRNTNDTLATATDLNQVATHRLHSDYDFSYAASLSRDDMVDYYKVVTPTNMSGGLQMVVTVRMADVSTTHAALHFFDANFNPVPFQVLTNAGNQYIVQISNLNPGMTYYTQVVSESASGYSGMGNYYFDLDFTNPQGQFLQSSLTNTLTQDNATTTGTLTLTGSQLMQFSLSASGATAGSSVTMVITDQSGRVVLMLTAVAGQAPLTAQIYLNAGTYNVSITASAPKGASTFDPLSYQLDTAILSDPLGSYTTGGDTSGGGSGGFSYGGGLTAGTTPTPSKSYYY